MPREACFQCGFHIRKFISSPAQSDVDSTIGNNSPTHRKMRVLKGGRLSRKREVAKLKRRDKELASLDEPLKGSEHQKQSQVLENDEPLGNELHEADPIERNENWHIAKILKGPQVVNPIRQMYIDSMTPWKFPRTIDGWRRSWRGAWNTYLWTWEGYLIPEKERDEHGNVIGLKKKEEDNITKETAKEKATEAATQIAQNVQNNIATIQHEAPKLLTTAQQLTGISTKEELKAWVSEQLKLATECLSMFMKGYREGRDDEVDKMLHEYFKELDDEKQTEESTDNAETATEQSFSGDNVPEARLKRNRPWGRQARRHQTRKKLIELRDI